MRDDPARLRQRIAEARKERKAFTHLQKRLEVAVAKQIKDELRAERRLRRAA